jgi:hypothetical protein
MKGSIYLTSSIQSFNVENDKLIMTYEFVKEVTDVKKGFFGDKIEKYGGGWFDEKDDLYDIKANQNAEFIREVRYCYDKNRVNEFCNGNLKSVTEYDYKCFLEDSFFHKWFKEHYGVNYYYIPISTIDGRVKKIKVYKKGYVQLNLISKEILEIHYQISNENVSSYIKKIGKAIQEYPFFKLDDDVLVFLNMNDNNNMNYIT